MDGRISYRKTIGPHAPERWHFNPQCPEYPTRNYIERSDLPPAENLCPKCAAPEE